MRAVFYQICERKENPFSFVGKGIKRFSVNMILLSEIKVFVKS